MIEQHSLSIFSFVKAGPRGTIASMWNVKPTGVYETDYFQGILYADEVLAQIKNRSPNLIGVMANAMPKKYSGLEDGFFRTLTKALMQAA